MLILKFELYIIILAIYLGILIVAIIV